MLLGNEYALDCSSKKEIVSSENKNRYILINDAKAVIYQYRIDGNKAKDIPKPVYSSGTAGERCDYIVEVVLEDSKSRLYIIELKGSDLIKAISQVKSTINLFSSDKNVFREFDAGLYEFYPRIVIHRVNTTALNSSETRKFKTQFPKYVVRTIKLEESVTKPAR